MEKFIVKIEFRYYDFYDGGTHCPSKEITLGIFDTRDEANEVGNKALEVFEKRFELNPYWNGKKYRFSNKGGCFGSPFDLATETYLNKVPFAFFASVRKLEFKDVDETITEVLEAVKRYAEAEYEYED